MVTVGSDNPFPSVLFEKHVDPSTPSTGTARLFVDSADNLLKWIDDDGTVTALSSGGVTDHGALTGLSDDDHTQYVLRSILTTNGDIFTRAAGAVSRLGIGSDGDVLTVASGAPSWAAPAGGGGGGMVWLQKQTANNTSQNLDFTSFISGSYDSYLFVLSDLLMATDNVDFYLRVGTGGGPTYDTGTNYNWDMFVWRNASTGTNGGAGVTFIALDDTGGGLDNATTTQGLNGMIWMQTPVGANFTQFQGKTKYRNNFGPSRVNSEIAGEYATTTTVTAVRFLASSGNISRGVIDVYGLVNS